MIITETGLAERFAAAERYETFLAAADANGDLWRAVDSHVQLPGDLLARAAAAAPTGRAIILAEDWCGDAVNLVPPVARFLGRLPGWEARLFRRDENLDLMESHLTGGSRSIPVVILYDAGFRELGWWGPRPAPLQAWVKAEGLAMPKDERYREIRKWYARDKGRTTLAEIVSLLEAAGRLP